MVRVLDSRSSGTVQVLAGDIVLCSWARHFTLMVLSPPSCINGYRQNAGGNPAIDYYPGVSITSEIAVHDSPLKTAV